MIVLIYMLENICIDRDAESLTADFVSVQCMSFILIMMLTIYIFVCLLFFFCFSFTWLWSFSNRKSNSSLISIWKWHIAYRSFWNRIGSCSNNDSVNVHKLAGVYNSQYLNNFERFSASVFIYLYSILTRMKKKNNTMYTIHEYFVILDNPIWLKIEF